jgi:hypothetical protein
LDQHTGDRARRAVSAGGREPLTTLEGAMPEAPIDRIDPRSRDGLQYRWRCAQARSQSLIQVTADPATMPSGCDPKAAVVLSHCWARRKTHARWHENVSACDVGTAERIPRVRARAQGIVRNRPSASSAHPLRRNRPRAGQRKSSSRGRDSARLNPSRPTPIAAVADSVGIARPRARRLALRARQAYPQLVGVGIALVCVVARRAQLVPVAFLEGRHG